jgi:hypothetical protein
MILIQIPPTYEEERRYVLGVVFGDFLGLDFKIETADRADVALIGGDNKSLIVADKLFSTPRDRWLTPESLPVRPAASVDIRSVGLSATVVSNKLPVIYGRGTEQAQWLRSSEKVLDLDLDIFGSIFFMLSRYEEAVLPDRDAHGRFPSSASFAGREGFLDRPIVNEYVEVLWACIKRLWPSIKRKDRSFRVVPTHDVDCPAYYAYYPKKEIFMKMAGDLVKRCSPGTALRRWRTLRDVGSGRALDPFDTFDWLMDLSESSGWTSTFNFIAGGDTKFDRPRYSFGHKLVRDLLESIKARGHEIGFHPSYATMTDGAAWKRELEALRAAAPGATIRGGRQHYLRFEVPTTWRFWDEAGLEYDSTLTYADVAGFRCGTCYDFPVFDLKSRKELRLRERPTIVMESTIISDRYMGFGTGDEARILVGTLKERCRTFNGDFVLLWHNSMLAGPGHMDLCRLAME